MRTDKIFHKIFSYFPEFFFQLIGETEWLQYYEPYQSEEVKETAFRLDGIFKPKDENHPLIFVEVQMKREDDFYHRVFSEVFLYLKQHQWAGKIKVIIIFKTKGNEPKRAEAFLPYFEQNVIEVYPLRAWFKQTDRTSLGLDTLRLIVAPTKEAITLAKSLLEMARIENASNLEQNFAEHISTIICYKFPNLNRSEVESMLDLGFDVKKTVLYQEFYQEGKVEGKAEGKAEGVEIGKAEMEEQERLRFASVLQDLLADKFGVLPEAFSAKLAQATTADLEGLYRKAWKAQSLEDLR